MVWIKKPGWLAKAKEKKYTQGGPLAESGGRQKTVVLTAALGGQWGARRRLCKVCGGSDRGQRGGERSVHLSLGHRYQLCHCHRDNFSPRLFWASQYNITCLKEASSMYVARLCRITLLVLASGYFFLQHLLFSSFSLVSSVNTVNLRLEVDL